MKRSKKPPLPSVKALSYKAARWLLYHAVGPVLEIFINPFCNWIESKQPLLFVPRYSLKMTRLFLAIGRDPSRNEPDYFFSAIQGNVWNLGWSYHFLYAQQRVKELMEAGFLDDALACVRKYGADQPWVKRRAAEILALQAGHPLSPPLEPAEGKLCWSIGKVLTEELPKWKKEDTDYIIAELYLRWESRPSADGKTRLIRPGVWDAVMAKIKESFPEARLLGWHGSCSCRASDYAYSSLTPEDESELKSALAPKQPG